MLTRPAFVVLLVCGLLTGQGLSLWHGIVHAGWPVHASGPDLRGPGSHGLGVHGPAEHRPDAHGQHTHGTDAHGRDAHGPGAHGKGGHGVAAVPHGGEHPESAVARCSIPDGAVPAAALLPYPLSPPSVPDAGRENAPAFLHAPPSRAVGGGQARAPPIPV